MGEAPPRAYTFTVWGFPKPTNKTKDLHVNVNGTGTTARNQPTFDINWEGARTLSRTRDTPGTDEGVVDVALCWSSKDVRVARCASSSPAAASTTTGGSRPTSRWPPDCSSSRRTARVLVHSDGGSYKPLNWMSPPCTMAEARTGGTQSEDGVVVVWRVQHAKSEDRLTVHIHEVLHDSAHELGVDPGLVKDGVEAHLQRLLAEHIHTLGHGWSLVRREYMTAIGPVDILAKDHAGPAWRSRSSGAGRSTASSS